MAKKKLSKVGRYKIVGELGRGAMGIVYRAEDPNLDRVVALKTILLSDDAEGRKDYHKRFFLEAKAAGKLNHPNVVTTFDCGDQVRRLIPAGHPEASWSPGRAANLGASEPHRRSGDERG